MKNFEQVQKILSKAFNYPENLVSLNTTPLEVENWNSMNHLLFISKIEDYFNIEIDAEDFEKLMKVEDILTLLNDKYCI